MRYDEVYPSEPLLRSRDVVRPRAGALMRLDFFEAAPAAMETRSFAEHHVLLNLREGTHRVENWRGGEHRDFQFQYHDVVVTPAGLESGWRWHATSRVIVVTIDPPALANFARIELGLVLGTRQLRDVPQAADADLCAAGVLVRDALAAGSNAADVMYEALARVFLVRLLEHYAERAGAEVQFGRGFGPEQYKRVLDLVAARFSTPLTVEDMALAAGISTAHFARLFRATIGATPYQYLTEYRIEQAKRMLGDPAMPIIEIALRSGFADQPHLTRTFKALTGMTPKGWRAAQ